MQLLRAEQPAAAPGGYGRVFRLLANDPLNDGMNTSLVAFDEGGERRRVARKRGAYKLVVRHTHELLVKANGLPLRGQPPA